MNIKTGDANLTSLWATDAVIANGIHYGTDIPLGAANRFLEGRTKIRFHITATFAGAGTTALVLYGGAAAAPTAVLKTIYTGTKAGLVIGADHELVLESHILPAFIRLGVNQSTLASVGGVKADVVPIKS